MVNRRSIVSAEAGVGIACQNPGFHIDISKIGLFSLFIWVVCFQSNFAEIVLFGLFIWVWLPVEMSTGRFFAARPGPQLSKSSPAPIAVWVLRVWKGEVWGHYPPKMAKIRKGKWKMGKKEIWQKIVNFW